MSSTGERTALIQCDDFGIAPSVSGGILAALNARAASSTSVMANLAPDQELRELARSQPAGTGVHLNLTLGTPLTSVSELAPLVAPDGRFRDFGTVLRACLSGRIPTAAIEREWQAQIDRVQAHQLKVTSLDAHQHVHWLKPLAELTAALARRFGIRRVRAPRKVLGARFQLRTLARDLLARAASTTLLEQGASSPHALIDLEICEGHARPFQVLAAALERAGPSIEICAHPATETVDDPAVFGCYDRRRQLEWLLGGELERTLTAGGFTVLR